MGATVCRAGVWCRVGAYLLIGLVLLVSTTVFLSQTDQITASLEDDVTDADVADVITEWKQAIG